MTLATHAAGLMVRLADTLFAEVAVIVAGVVAPTGEVFTVKVALLEPCGIVTLGGTVADPVLLDRLTSTPPGPATAFSVTVAVEGCPPVTLLGFRVRLMRVPRPASPGDGGKMCTEAPTLLLEIAVIAGVMSAWTRAVLIVKLTVVAPSGIVTPAGVIADGLLLHSVTSAPPGGAGALRANVPIVGSPPATEYGVTVNDSIRTRARRSPSGNTKSGADAVAEGEAAVITTVLSEATARVAIRNSAELTLKDLQAMEDLLRVNYAKKGAPWRRNVRRVRWTRVGKTRQEATA